MLSSKRRPNMASLMRALHSYSAMLVLVLLLFFALTGITLNHPDLLNSNTGKYSRQQVLALPLALQLAAIPHSTAEQADIAERFRLWLQQEHQLKSSVFQYQFEPQDMLLDIDFKRPAGYASVLVDFAQGTVELEEDFAGYLALLNELHKGRNAGLSWLLLLDFTAVACILFSLTGFYLIAKQASRRSIGNSLAMLGVFLGVFAYVFSLH